MYSRVPGVTDELFLRNRRSAHCRSFTVSGTLHTGLLSTFSSTVLFPRKKTVTGMVCVFTCRGLQFLDMRGISACQLRQGHQSNSGPSVGNRHWHRLKTD